MENYMQPLGRKPCKLPSKTDYHFKFPIINWWEGIIPPNKTSEKTKTKNLLKMKLMYF